MFSEVVYCYLTATKWQYVELQQTGLTFTVLFSTLSFDKSQFYLPRYLVS